MDTSGWGQEGNALIEQMFSDLPPGAEEAADMPEVAFVPCMDGARGAREKSDMSAKRSGAAMYAAFECGRCGRWP